MASYIEEMLGRDEDIVARAAITPWVFFLPVVITCISFGLLFPILIIPFIRIKTTELGVTNKRVIAKSGLISRRTIEQRIQKIESIRVNQGIFGRLFGFGSIMVHGTGGATTPITMAADPFSFKPAVESVVDDFETGTAEMSSTRRQSIGDRRD